MISLNKVQILGNLTRDPEVRYIPSGQAVTSFSVATNRRWNDKDGNAQEDTQFHEVVAWGKLAEIISQMLKKGNKIYVEGRLQTRNWEAPDGAKRQKTEIVLENFIPLAPKTGSTESSGFYSASTAKPESSAPSKPVKEDKKPATEDSGDDTINLDDIPF